ncbi:hypothetical protein [Nocardioides marmoribigeumensis]|uniref:MFS transporter n=1 Tax=Nocardioides marmoribigeumensis TaxID=433649 RepID=A0ABU2BXV1_9ACTN|nr:hypothetical protein [Nocardioides marmoribigeumensis]MDR7363221.1 hypothetical protein [Nocardioides marmoribigeumensis]
MTDGDRGPVGLPGHRPGTPGYRRVVGALVAAGLATFALLSSTQAILPELSQAFAVSPSPGRSPWWSPASAC